MLVRAGSWFLLVLLSCAGLRSTPTAMERALPPGRGGALADLENALAEALGPDRSAFHLIDVNADALRWRLALIDSAQHSLDLMTFLWWGDEVGDLVLKRVLDAADRGVKVRLIVDDLTTIDDGKQYRLRDMHNAAIDAHPNIELRVFNPWNNRQPAGRVVEFMGDFERLNQRMHNKALIADSRAAVVGGRNLGNEYMGLNPAFNFRDVDVLTVGHASRQVAQVFDRYWNSKWVVPQQSLGDSGTTSTLQTERRALEHRLSAASALRDFALAPQNWAEAWASFAKNAHPGRSRVTTDTPDDHALTHHMPETILQFWSSATREVLVTNAYIIPDEAAFKRTAAGVKPGVRFVMLTNSLASTDAPGVHAHYTDWRPKLVAGGVELYELRHDAAIRHQVADTAPVQGAFVGLHSKAIVVDRRQVLIGSTNLDPRSWVHNTEMGLIIDCAPLAIQLAEAIERDVKPENAWRIEVGQAGEVRWQAGNEVRRSPPIRDPGQPFEESLHLLFPTDLY
jgi:cardiolipin synthase C